MKEFKDNISERAHRVAVKRYRKRMSKWREEIERLLRRAKIEELFNNFDDGFEFWFEVPKRLLDLYQIKTDEKPEGATLRIILEKDSDCFSVYSVDLSPVVIGDYNCLINNDWYDIPIPSEFKDKLISIAKNFTENTELNEELEKKLNEVFSEKESEVYSEKESFMGYSSQIIEDIKWALFDDREFKPSFKFATWVGDGHGFIIEDDDGQEYRVMVTKED